MPDRLATARAQERLEGGLHVKARNHAFVLPACVPAQLDGDAPDGERITIKLRSGARWHDDRVVSGLDVQATFEPLLRASGRQAIWHAMLEDVEGVDVLPEREARFRLRRPSDLVLRALCEIPILPAESLRKAGSAASQLGRQPVGTGPFRFASWEHGKRIRLVRSRPPDRPGPPFLDEIVFEIDGDGLPGAGPHPTGRDPYPAARARRALP